MGCGFRRRARADSRRPTPERCCETGRLVAAVIPAQSGPVAVGQRHVRGVATALLNQRPLGIVQQFLRRDRAAQVCDPTTHGILSHDKSFHRGTRHARAGRIQRFTACSRTVPRISMCTKPSLRITWRDHDRVRRMARSEKPSTKLRTPAEKREVWPRALVALASGSAQSSAQHAEAFDIWRGALACARSDYAFGRTRPRPHSWRAELSLLNPHPVRETQQQGRGVTGQRGSANAVAGPADPADPARSGLPGSGGHASPGFRSTRQENEQE